MNHYYYLHADSRIIRVVSRTKPKRSGSYLVQEFDGSLWKSPVFPDITGYRLSKLKYIGSVKTKKMIGFISD